MSLSRPVARVAAALAAIVVMAGIGTAITTDAASAAPRVDVPMQLRHPHLGVTTGTTPDAGDFDPGLIISDYEFYNADSMTEQQVDAFLWTIGCAPEDASPCLREYHESTTDQPAQEAGHCRAYRGAHDETAARIITRVARACGISPKVLLVLLQKEQSLLTRPDARGYLRATGYACPDTADCHAKYFGFFNQVYNAAWQFRQYTEHPVRAYHVGTVEVRFDPDAACGSSAIRIRNQATANLYNYTPYQPDPAALANLGAEGDACSSYGNLNFWRLYTQWFGDPTRAPYPTVFGACANLVGGHPCRAPEFVMSAP